MRTIGVLLVAGGVLLIFSTELPPNNILDWLRVLLGSGLAGTGFGIIHYNRR